MRRFFTVLAAWTAILLPPVAWGQTPQALRLGVFPDAGSLPILVANQEGLFAAEGISVKVSLFQSAVERDAAFQAGALDGMVGDLIGAALLADRGFPVKVTSECDGRFGLVAAPQEGSFSLRDLGGTPIAGSLHTIIQFFADTALANAGVAAERVTYLSVPKMALRLEMVAGGQVKAAALAEPFLTVALSRGAHLLASSEGMAGAQAVVLFAGPYQKSQVPTLEAFYRAYDRAAAKIDATPDVYRDFLVKNLRFPEQVRDTYRFDRYTPHRAVPRASVQAALVWMNQQHLLTGALTPEQLIP
jgi:NitT/TauT family transport system substrate-binding protein